MPIPTFTTNIPTANQSLGNTQQNINNNFANYFQTLSVNHGAPNSANAGKHNFVEMPDQSTNPATLKGEVGLFGKNIATLPTVVSELFFIRDAGSPAIQMTDGTPIVTTNGSTFLPGGVIMKWGTQVLVNNVNTTVTYASAFPTGLFSLIVKAQGGGVNMTYLIPSPLTGFTAVATPGNTIYYIAIGN